MKKRYLRAIRLRIIRDNPGISPTEANELAQMIYDNKKRLDD